jgi:hypothetical protein
MQSKLSRKLFRPPGRPKYRLTIEPVEAADDPIRWLRKLLKRMRRGYGFRCLEAVEMPADIAMR